MLPDSDSETWSPQLPASRHKRSSSVHAAPHPDRRRGAIACTGASPVPSHQRRLLRHGGNPEAKPVAEDRLLLLVEVVVEEEEEGGGGGCCFTLDADAPFRPLCLFFLLISFFLFLLPFPRPPEGSKGGSGLLDFPPQDTA